MQRSNFGSWELPKDPKKGSPSLFDQHYTIVGSGVYYCERPVARPVAITGPFVDSNQVLKPAEYERSENAARLAERLRRQPGVVGIEDVALSDFADMLVRVARSIKEYRYDVVLCPLRGGRIIGLETNLICQSEPIEPFDGSDMGRRLNEQRNL